MDLLPDTGDDLDYDSSNEGLDLFMDDDEPAEPGDSGSKKGYRRITVEPTTFLLCDIIIGVVIIESSYHFLVLYCGRVLINTAHTII